MSAKTSKEKPSGAAKSAAKAAQPVAQPIFRCDGTRFAAGVKVESYNFRNPGFLCQADLRQIELVHQKFAEHLSARISTFLRMECSVKLTNFGSSTFGAFTESIKAPAHVALFQVEPLRGVGLLDLSLPLCLAMADRILGGKGRAPESERNLSEIETALVEDAIHLILGEWCQQWRSDLNLQAKCIGHDTSARFLQTSPPETVVLMAAIEIALGETNGRIQLGVPYSMIEAMVKKLQADPHKADEALAKKIQWRSPYNTIAVPVVAEWQAKEMRIQELIDLSLGDVLPMSNDLISQTHVRLADTRQFLGSVGVQNGRIAVQLTNRKALE
jgi:flagellar motor switch protein FliM